MVSLTRTPHLEETRAVFPGVAAYLACGVALVLVQNDDAQNGDWLAALLVVLALALGWQAAIVRDARRAGLCLLPLVLLGVAVPFGDTNKVTGGDDIHLVSTYMIGPVLASMVAAGIGFAAHVIYFRRSDKARRHPQGPK